MKRLVLATGIPKTGRVRTKHLSAEAHTDRCNVTEPSNLQRLCWTTDKLAEETCSGEEGGLETDLTLISSAATSMEKGDLLARAQTSEASTWYQSQDDPSVFRTHLQVTREDGRRVQV